MNIKEAFQEYPLAKKTVGGIILLWFLYSIILYIIADKPDKEQVSERSSVTVQVHYAANNDKIRPENNAAPSIQVSKITTTEKEPIEDSGFFKTVGDNYGTFGDSFGALNTLFSGLAFTAVFFSLMMQSRALKETRKDFEIQQEEIAKQNFANQFHSLMEERRFKIQSLTIGKMTNLYNQNGNISYSGFEVFHVYVHDFISYIESPTAIYDYSQLWRDLEADTSNALGYYFSYIFKLCEFIDNAPKFIDKKFYSDILRTSLSASEVVCIFWFGITATKKNKDLIKKFGLIERVGNRPSLVSIALTFYNRDDFFGNPFWENTFDKFEKQERSNTQ